MTIRRTLITLGMILVLTLPFTLPLMTQPTQLPVSVIWNRVYSASIGEAQGVQRSIAEIMNLLFNPGNNTLNLGGGGALGPNTVGPSELISTTVTSGSYGSANSVMTGTSDADGRLTAAATVPIAITFSNHTDVDLVTFPPINGAIATWDSTLAKAVFRLQEGAGPVTIPGIVTNPVTGVDSIHYSSVTLTDTCGLLGSVTYINIVQTLTSGVTCFLPDPSLLSTPSKYVIFIDSAHFVTLAPSGTNLLNTFNAPLPSIRGPQAMYIVERKSDTAWQARAYYPAGLGEPFTSICTSFGGSTNTSSSGSGTWIGHTLSCVIPANKITLGTTIEVCAGVRLVSGSAPPSLKTRFKANGTVIWEASAAQTTTANVPGHTGRQCMGIMGTSLPGVSATLETSVIEHTEQIQYGALTSTIGCPVTVDTSVLVILTFESFFATAGTGTTSLEEKYLDVKGARFAN